MWVWLRYSFYCWGSFGHGCLVAGEWQLLVDAVSWPAGLVVHCRTFDISLVSDLGSVFVLD